MTPTKAVVVNLSSSGSRLGGAAIAAEFHCRYIAKHYPLELWRMWDKNEAINTYNLTIRNYSTKSRLSWTGDIFPNQFQACFLTSDIIKDIHKKKPLLVHLQNPLPALQFKKIASLSYRNRSKIVASTHGFHEVLNSNYSFSFPKQIAWKYFVSQNILKSLKYIDVVLSGYPEEKSLLTACGVPEEKIILVPNGINPFFLEYPSKNDSDKVCKKFGIKSEKPILLFIGNHTANKGIDTVMRVAHQLSIPATVVVGGRLLSPGEPEEWQAAFQPNSDVDVVFTDYLTLEEQRAFYHLATLLLFPSVSDTLPLTIIEAMACKLPVVAYDVGGISYQLDHESGVVVPKGSFTEYLQTVETLLNDQNQRLYLGNNAKIRQQSIFSWESAAKKTISVYESLLN